MITVFGYDFPHKKTCEGLIQLKLLNIPIKMVYLAPWRELHVRQPSVRISGRGFEHWQPSDICRLLDIPFRRVHHNSINGEHDTGIILGARILEKKTIDRFRRGIINLHPGKLPDFRELDCVHAQYAYNGTSGITAHWIDEKVDQGKIICYWEVPTYHTEDWVERYDRNLNLQVHVVLPEVLEMIG